MQKVTIQSIWVRKVTVRSIWMQKLQFRHFECEKSQFSRFECKKSRFGQFKCENHGSVNLSAKGHNSVNLSEKIHDSPNLNVKNHNWVDSDGRSHNSVNSGAKIGSTHILSSFNNIRGTRDLQRIWALGDFAGADPDKLFWTDDYQLMLFWLSSKALAKSWHRFDSVKHCKTTVGAGVWHPQRGRPPFQPPPAEPKDASSPRERELCEGVQGRQSRATS
jgi:hypothetical protein